MPEFQMLSNKRSRLKGTLTRISNLQIDDDTTIDEIQIRIEKLDDLWTEFHEVEDQLSVSTDFKSYLDKFEEDYFNLKSKLRNVERRLSELNTSAAGASSIAMLAEQQRSFIEEVAEINRHSQDVHLPKLTLNPFYGDYNEWPSFKDMYLSSIHNTHLTNAQKLQHLKNLMKGSAATVLRNTKITNDNYDLAWQSVLDRFDRKKFIIYSYVNQFFNIAPIVKVSAATLRTVTDAAEENIRGLQALGNAATCRDPFLIHIILQKLDRETRAAWSKHSASTEFPTWNQLLLFLKDRCDILENEIIMNSPNPSKQSANIRNHLSTASVNCPKCGDSHRIQDCLEFKALTVDHRKQFVYSNNLCIWCLRSGHTARNCQFNKICYLCQNKGLAGKHHYLLHYGAEYDKSVTRPRNSTNIISVSTANLNNELTESETSQRDLNDDGAHIISTYAHVKSTQEDDCKSTNKGSRISEGLRQDCLKSNVTRNGIFEIIAPSNVLHAEINTKRSSKNNDHQIAKVNTSNNNGTLLYTQLNALLPTAIISIWDQFGKIHRCRALLDSGSQANLITEACVQRLNISRSKANISVNGVASSGAGKCNGIVRIQISSRFSNEIQFNTNALILSKLTSSMPSMTFSVQDWNYVKDLKLADPEFYSRSNIDLILGAQIFFEILQPGKLVSKENKSIAQSTTFGWVISGELPAQPTKDTENLQCNISNLDLSKLLCRFWEIEEVPRKTFVNEEELQCESHFQETFEREGSGKFVLRLPFKTDQRALGNSFNQAMSRFLSMERRFNWDPQMKEEYFKFMNEYLSLGHMEQITESEITKNNSECFYLPHFAIVKESTTTKTRVVFDGSMKSSNGVSINDKLLVGPVVQPNMITSLLRFRYNEIAFSADIEKMYRQIWIHPVDLDFQRILWRTTPEESLKHYRLKTVTYGLSCAPFQATRSLKQISIECEDTKPKIAKLIREQFYVDDLLCSVDNIQEAKSLQQNLVETLGSYGMNLRKWKSNSAELLSTIPVKDRDTVPRSLDDKEAVIKILGLQWEPKDDMLTYKYSAINTTEVTKRSILSEISKLFDPIGLVAPIVIQFKIFMQKLWIDQIDWDDPITNLLLIFWNDIKGQLAEVHKIRIPRCIKIRDAKSTQLIGFCDASDVAYGAVLYLRSIATNGQLTIRIIASKSRVAPTKSTSTPRLELNAAVLLCRLMVSVKESLNINYIETINFTDSTTVLAWLSQPPRNWKTYVANRTSEILESTVPTQWRYVKSKANPADLVSRGVSTNQLVTSPIWWEGPEWLKLNMNDWPKEQYISHNSTQVNKEEKKKVMALVTTAQDEFFKKLVNRFSSLSKLIMCVAGWFRIIKYFKTKKPYNSVITVVEYQEAETFCIKRVQEAAFTRDIEQLKLNKIVHPKSKLLTLHPFIDALGILRVGGRLAKSSLPYDCKHPKILPYTDHFSKLLVEQYHHRYLHAGPTLLVAIIKQKYWIIRCRDLTKLVVNKCLVCFKYKQQAAKQLMGDVPKARTEIHTRPFIHVGTDYAGPVLMKMCKGRSKTLYKAYIVIYVCLSTKALTIDLVTDLSSEAFIASLSRFCSRRGVPHHIYSDNATTFVGAQRQIQQLFIAKESRDRIMKYSSSQGIIWHFIPPLSPHVGGLWESGVKSVKFHMKRVINGQTMSYEELQTLLLQIESLLNSRPLCSILNNQPEELEYLTPGHFIIGESFTALPYTCVETTPMNRLTRFERIEKLKQSFWKQWSKSYLNSLQHRPKWQRETQNLEIGDLVLVKEDGVSPGSWLMARIIKCFPGDDGKVRVVEIKTKSGIYKRTINKLVPLPNDEIIKDPLNGAEHVGTD